MVVESNGAVAEDVSWLQLIREDKHINLALLDAVLRGINLALPWKAETIHRRTDGRMDSSCMHCWVSDTLFGQIRECTKAPSEMLMCRLATLRELATEYELDINVGLVKSHDNRADELTQIQWQWLEENHTVAEPKETMYAVTEELDVARIQDTHQSSGHPSVKRTQYFVKLVNPRVPRATVQTVVRDCRECQSIDLAPVQA